MIIAGETTDAESTGGNVVIQAGEGSSAYQFDGGDGGKEFVTAAENSILLSGVVQIYGGAAQGGLSADNGGNVEVAAGFAKNGRGGSIVARTGFGEATSSGIIDISTANGGESGVSGSIDFSTGTSSAGNSGYINIETGEATGGRAGPSSVFFMS